MTPRDGSKQEFAPAGLLDEVDVVAETLEPEDPLQRRGQHAAERIAHHVRADDDARHVGAPRPGPRETRSRKPASEARRALGTRGREASRLRRRGTRRTPSPSASRRRRTGRRAATRAPRPAGSPSRRPASESTAIAGTPFLIASTSPCSRVVTTTSIRAISDSTSRGGAETRGVDVEARVDRDHGDVPLAEDAREHGSRHPRARPSAYSVWRCTSTRPTTGTVHRCDRSEMSGRAPPSCPARTAASNGFHSSSGWSIDRLTPTSRQPANRGRNSVIGQPLPNGPQTKTTCEYLVGSTPRQSTPPVNGAASATSNGTAASLEPAADDVSREQVACGGAHLLEAEPPCNERSHVAVASSRSRASTRSESKYSSAISRAARCMALIAPLHVGDAGRGLLGRRERDDALARRQHAAEARVLDDDRPARCEVAGGAAAEPAGAAGDVAALGDAPLRLGRLDVPAIGVRVCGDGRGIDDAPPGLPQGLSRRTAVRGARLPAKVARPAERDLEPRRPHCARQIDEPPELDVLLPERAAAVAERPVARPAHDGREDIAGPALGTPLREQDRLARRPPLDPLRERRLADPLAEAEEDVVSREPPLELLLPARERELHLREDRIRVDVHEPRDLAVVRRALQRAGDVDQQVRGPEHLAALRVRQPVPARLDREPVEPAVAEPEALHHRREVAHVRRRVVGDPAFLAGAAFRQIRPLAGVLEVVDVVAEPSEAGGKLDVVPRDAAEARVLRDQAGDHDSELVAHAAQSRPRRCATWCAASKRQPRLPAAAVQSARSPNQRKWT